MHRFLCLFKRRAASKVDARYEVIEEEFRVVTKQSKRRNTSSIFSKRDYYGHECATYFEGMVKVLVRFCNLLIKNNHFPLRWLDVSDEMMEKGNGIK